MKRTLSLILAFLMAASALVSCAEDNTETAGDTTVKATDEEEVVVEEDPNEELTTAVPEELDYDGRTVNFYYYNNLANYWLKQDELTGENVVDAIFNANHNVMDYLNVAFDYFEDTTNEVTTLVNSVIAGDGAYDLAYATQWKLAPVLTKHYFLSFKDAEYINFDMPWWNDAYMQESATGNGDIYMLAGDLNLNVIRRASCMVMNNDLYTAVGMNPADIKSAILEGGWTLDKLQEVTEAIYIDNNGDGARGPEDTYGISTWTRSDVDHLVIDAGLRATYRDADGVPQIDFNNEKSVECTEKIRRLFWENTGMYYVEGAPCVQMLSENRVGFLMIKFYDLEGMREVETDYTIVPMPKQDELVDRYYALVHDDVTLVCKPTTCKDSSLTDAVIEQLAFEGYKGVIPQYYEISLKHKYTRNMDDDNVRIIDCIHDGITTEFSYVYNYALGSIICDLRNIGLESTFNFASYYAKKDKVFKKSFEKLLKQMNEE